MVHVQQWTGKGDVQGNESDLGFRISPFPDRLTIVERRICRGVRLSARLKPCPSVYLRTARVLSQIDLLPIYLQLHSATMVWMAEQEPGELAQVQAAASQLPEAWRRTELARHPERPYPMDFIAALFSDFSEIHGDRGLRRRHGDGVRHGELSWTAGDGGGQPEGPLDQRAAWRASSAHPIRRATARRCDAMRIAEKFGQPGVQLSGRGGRQPRHRRGRARSGRGHRSQPAGDVAAASAYHCNHYRRGRVGRRAGAGRGRPRADVGELHLLGDIARGMRVDHVEGLEQEKQQAADALKVYRLQCEVAGLRRRCAESSRRAERTTTQSWPWRWWTSDCCFIWLKLDTKPMEQLLEERYQKFRNIAQFYTTAE